MTRGHRRVLEVDLSAGSTAERRIPVSWTEKYLGGRGLGLRLLLAEQPPGRVPFDPENVLVFTAGPLTGTGIPGSARHWVGGLSPRTGRLGEAFVDGRFGCELSRTGYLAVIVRGRADSLVSIRIGDETVEIEDATDLWGATVDDCTQRLTRDDGSCACIGPAGENFAKIAGIVHDRGRPTGDGLGAAMGAKRVKAIVADGSTSPAVDDPDALANVRSSITELCWERFREREGSNRPAQPDAVQSLTDVAVADFLPEVSPETRLEIHRRCRQFGLDPVGVARGIAAAATAFDDRDATRQEEPLVVIEEMAYGEGLGEILADGAESIRKHLGVDVHSDTREPGPGERSLAEFDADRLRAFLGAVLLSPGLVENGDGDVATHLAIRGIEAAVGRRFAPGEPSRIGERSIVLGRLFACREISHGDTRPNRHQPGNECVSHWFSRSRLEELGLLALARTVVPESIEQPA